MTTSYRVQRQVTPGRPRGRAEDRNLKEKILVAAIRLFGERGFDGTSLKLIADTVGVTAPALYNHYRNKRQLVFASLMHVMEEMAAEGEAALAAANEKSIPKKLRCFAYANALFQIRYRQMQPLYIRVLYGEGARQKILTASQTKKVQGLQRQHYKNLRDLLAAGVAEGSLAADDIPVTTFCLFALGEHVNSWFRPGRGKSAEDVARAIADLSLRMVAAG